MRSQRSSKNKTKGDPPPRKKRKTEQQQSQSLKNESFFVSSKKFIIGGGQLFLWGQGGCGQLGLGSDMSTKFVPQFVSSLEDHVVTVSLAANHTVALLGSEPYILLCLHFCNS